jgi:hypothetical protein
LPAEDVPHTGLLVDDDMAVEEGTGDRVELMRC